MGQDVLTKSDPHDGQLMPVGSPALYHSFSHWWQKTSSRRWPLLPSERLIVGYYVQGVM